MDSLGAADLFVILFYLSGITWMGIRMGKAVRDSGDFFMPRSFGKGKMIMHAFGTGTASDQAVSVASATFQQGLAGIWYQWLWLFSTPFYWIIAPIMRRFRAITLSDIFELRYDKSIAGLFACIGILSMSVKIGVMLKGAGALVEAGTAGTIQSEWAIIGVTVLFVTYGMAGGLGAAIVTDFIQGLLTIAFSFMLLPFVLHSVGGIDGMKRTIETGITDRDMLSMVAPGEVGLFFIVMLSVQALVGIVAFPSVLGNCAAGKTEWEGRIGFMCGAFIKRLCTVAWCLTSLAAVAWYLQSGVNLDSVPADHVYGDIARAFLPEIMPGLLGIFIATLLAAVMSSCDSFMIAASGLFTENLYRHARPGLSKSHYVRVGRISALMIVLMGVGFAFWVEDVVKGLMIWFKITPMMGIPFWIGLVWRRMNVAGAWTSTLTGFGAWWLCTRGFFVEWLSGYHISQSLGLIWKPSLNVQEMYEPWVICFYLTVSTTLGVAVSLATRSVSKDKLDRYYALINTPIQPGEESMLPCQLPDGVGIERNRPMWLNRFDFEIPRPSKQSITGFLIGWLFVAFVIGAFVWLMR